MPSKLLMGTARLRLIGGSHRASGSPDMVVRVLRYSIDGKGFEPLAIGATQQRPPNVLLLSRLVLKAFTPSPVKRVLAQPSISLPVRAKLVEPLAGQWPSGSGSRSPRRCAPQRLTRSTPEIPVAPWAGTLDAGRESNPRPCGPFSLPSLSSASEFHETRCRTCTDARNLAAPRFSRAIRPVIVRPAAKLADPSGFSPASPEAGWVIKSQFLPAT